jgi:tetratricopeptide (TPR) repeat protein
MKTVVLILFSLLLNISIIAQTDKAKSKLYFEKASTYFDAQNYKMCILYCDSAIITNTENLEAYAYRGVCKFQLKQYAAAIEDFDLALILNNAYAEVYYYRGICKKELGADKQACEDWYEAYNLGYKKVMSIIKEHCKLEEDTKKEKTK